MSVSTRNRSLHPASLDRRGTGLLSPDFSVRRQTLPVFLSDNHAETFGWITRTFDPDERYQLVLVDAHSDAIDGRALRGNPRRAAARAIAGGARCEVEEWRKSGRIQAFNWIEPLMPRPLDQVCWLAAPELGETRRAAIAPRRPSARSTAGLEVEPRSAGSFAERWTTVDLAGSPNWQPGARPVILAIDLDFFAGMEPANASRSFETIWQRAMDWPGLRGCRVRGFPAMAGGRCGGGCAGRSCLRCGLPDPRRVSRSGRLGG